MDTTVFCQGCLSTKDLVPYRLDYVGLFQSCFNLKVGFGATHLEWICKKCVSKLEIAIEFRTKVEETQKYIKQHRSEKCKNMPPEIKLEEMKEDFMEFEVDFDTLDRGESAEPLATNMQPKSELVDSDINRRKRKIAMKPPQPTKRRRKPTLVKKRHICRTCSREFVDECSLSVHRVNEHSARANVPEFGVMLVCSYCRLTFTKLDEMNQHMIGQHEANSHKVKWDTRNFVPCTICGFHFRDYSARSYHFHKVHKLIRDMPQKMLQKCSECEESFKNYYSEVIHMYNEHRKRIRMPQGGMTMYCKQCDKDFFGEFLYKNHMKESHGTEIRTQYSNNRCRICLLFFTKRRHCLSHTVEHGETKNMRPKQKKNNPETKYKCIHCLETFPLYSQRRIHLEEVHNIKDIFTCEFCAKELGSNKTLQRHLRTHTKEYVAICDYCGYGVNDKYELIAHFTKHFEGKKYKCGVCSREFKSNTSLRRHKKIHDDFKRFLCTLCDMRFTHKYNYDAHMNRHKKQSILNEFPGGEMSYMD